jgi:hypothetical protein
MDSKIVNREIRAVIWPYLKSVGFSSFSSRTAWRQATDRIDVINFQSFNSYLADGLGCTSYSFALNLGIYLLAIPAHGLSPKTKRGQFVPNEFDCHYRRKLDRSLAQPELARRDIWFIDSEGHYLADAIGDAKDSIGRVGLPWFESLSDASFVLEDLCSGELESDSTFRSGALDSYARNRIIGYLAKRLGKHEMAYRYLSRALEQATEIDRANAGLKLRKPMPRMTEPELEDEVRNLEAVLRTS